MTIRDWIFRALAYILLTAFGLFMLFPFIYMITTSLKTSNDVFNTPPRLLPYSPVLVEYNGELVPSYQFEIGGETVTMVTTGERVRFGFFTSPELINAASPRDSEILYEYPFDDAIETDTVLTLGGEEFDLYEIDVDGEVLTLPLVYRGSKDEFVSIDDPDLRVFAVERLANQVEKVEFQFSNYEAVFDLNLDRALVNTTIVTIGVVMGQLITSIMGGYAFSRIPFKGRNSIFLMYLGSIMIPFVVLIIPIYRLMVVIGWQNRLVSLIVPWIFSAYGTFLMRQFFISIPKELEEAALMDGASRFRILWTIFVPLSRPAIATLAIFSFLYAWNSFLWPLLIIGEGNVDNHVLTLSLIRLSNSFADQPNMVLTGAAVAILPPVIVFVLAQRYFIEGVASSGLKG